MLENVMRNAVIFLKDFFLSNIVTTTLTIIDIVEALKNLAN